MRAAAPLFLLIALGCGAHPDTYGGTYVPIDGSTSCDVVDAGAPYVPCDTNQDCIDFFAPLAPSGILYATCFNVACMSAEQCVATHAGVMDYCTCGSAMVPAWPFELCVAASATDEPELVPYCH